MGQCPVHLNLCNFEQTEVGTEVMVFLVNLSTAFLRAGGEEAQGCLEFY